MADEQNTTGTEQDADETLGESGIKALKAEREARRQAEKALADANRRLADIEAAQLRADVARAKGLTDAQAKRLTGTTREELEADADDLLAAFGAPTGTTASPFGRPKERLTPGASRGEGLDVDKLAERIIRR
ncbi:hypothetical protein [Actinomadura sp. SCN-SB]|uniref:hypothetical protein n=1 Tax=Actinomadura sp. SCN-SB TaxID=3373092 RepID=UPI00375194B3